MNKLELADINVGNLSEAEKANIFVEKMLKGGTHIIEASEFVEIPHLDAIIPSNLDLKVNKKPILPNSPKISPEKVISSNAYPFFAKLLPGLELYCSEEFSFIPVLHKGSNGQIIESRTKYNKAPDLFYSKPYFVKLKSAPNNDLDPSRKFAIVPSKSLFTEMIVGDAKVDINDVEFYRFFQYGSILSTGSDDSICKTFLFDPVHVWLVENEANVVKRIIKIPLKGRGSAKAFKDFFADYHANGLYDSLNETCIKLGLNSETLANIGNGGSSSVFSCERISDKLLVVLKFGYGTFNRCILNHEFTYLSTLVEQYSYNFLQNYINLPFPEVNITETGSSASLLFYPVAIPGNQLDSELFMNSIPDIIKSLLKLHELGIPHGDCRLANLLFVNNSIFLWNDLLYRQSDEENGFSDNYYNDPFRFDFDWNTLIVSMAEYMNSISIRRSPYKLQLFFNKYKFHRDRFTPKSNKFTKSFSDALDKILD